MQQDTVDDEAEQLFMQLAEDTEDVPFAITKSAEVFTEYKVSEPHVVIFKKVSCWLYLLNNSPIKPSPMK